MRPPASLHLTLQEMLYITTFALEECNQPKLYFIYDRKLTLFNLYDYIVLRIEDADES